MNLGMNGIPAFYSRICTKELGLHVLSKANYEKSDK